MEKRKTARPTTERPGGIGRAWPLLTGERAHYELAAGRRDEAIRLMHVMESLAGDGGMIPEQVWDADDIPERGLFKGRPSGSAMPLAWAHAEYLKLRRSIQDGRTFDQPPQTVAALPEGQGRLRPRDLAVRPPASGSCRATYCGSRCWRLPWSIGAATAGTRATRAGRATPGSAFTSPTWTPGTQEQGNDRVDVLLVRR